MTNSHNFVLATILISFVTLIQLSVSEETTTTLSSTNDTGTTVSSWENEDGVNLNEYRYYEETSQYEKVGTTEPCKDNMRFFAIPGDAKKGQCDCDWYDCSRPLIYSKETGACHWAWSQGPCKEGEWYTFDEALKPICEKNTCPQSPAENSTISDSGYYFKRPEDGKCYEAGSRGYCKEDEGILMIYPNEPIPICRTHTKCYPLSFPPHQLCAPGNKRTQDGLCTEEEKN